MPPNRVNKTAISSVYTFVILHWNRHSVAIGVHWHRALTGFPNFRFHISHQFATGADCECGKISIICSASRPKVNQLCSDSHSLPIAEILRNSPPIAFKIIIILTDRQTKREKNTDQNITAAQRYMYNKFATIFIVTQYRGIYYTAISCKLFFEFAKMIHKIYIKYGSRLLFLIVCKTNMKAAHCRKHGLGLSTSVFLKPDKCCNFTDLQYRGS